LARHARNDVLGYSRLCAIPPPTEQTEGDEVTWLVQPRLVNDPQEDALRQEAEAALRG
jgi:hypothetical protein